MVTDVFSGEYHSVFKGRGMEFAEVREYQPGDDIRLIDWNVTARSGAPFVKVFNEERELTVILMMDISGSGSFGTRKSLKEQLAVEICALLAFSAIRNNDKVGLILFTDTVEKYVPPRKGKQHVLRILRDVIYHEPEHRTTDIRFALDFLLRVTRRHSVVFLVSDFLGSGYERTLRVANSKHDVVAIHIFDPREMTLPDVGLVSFQDAETGAVYLVDTKRAAMRASYERARDEERRNREALFRAMRLDFVSLRTDRSYVEPLYRLFRERARRLHR